MVIDTSALPAILSGESDAAHQRYERGDVVPVLIE